MTALHNNPVSQVTQAAQVLKKTVVFTFERLATGPYQGMTQCLAKFREGSQFSEAELSATGRSLDKKECKMIAASELLQMINNKYGDWKDLQVKNRKSKKRQYKTEYRKRQEEEKKRQERDFDYRERMARLKARHADNSSDEDSKQQPAANNNNNYRNRSPPAR